MSSNVLSSTPVNVGSTPLVEFRVQPVSCGDESAKVLFKGINDEMSLDENPNTVQVRIR